MDELPSIAIIGAGPVGIEAALYGRYLGYPVTVFDREPVCCGNVLDWGHVTMFTPFGMNCSSLGLKALANQSNEQAGPGPGEYLTGLQWAERYLHPLAASDLLDGCFRLSSTVLAISRDGQLPTQNVSKPERDETRFRILYDDGLIENVEYFDVVIDASGNYNNPAMMGSGGAPAIGELELREFVSHEDDPGDHLYSPFILDPEHIGLYPGDRFAVVGNGFSAATNLMLLNELRATRPGLKCTWISRRSGDPVQGVPDDPLPHRRALVESVNRLARGGGWVDFRPGSNVHSVRLQEAGFTLQLLESGDMIEVDHLFANVGYESDWTIAEALQVHRCYATGAPMNWALAMGSESIDCLHQKCPGPSAVKTTEPDFYVIGIKSFGRDSRFLFQAALGQIRDVYRNVGGRDSLDLYSTMSAAGTWGH